MNVAAQRSQEFSVPAARSSTPASTSARKRRWSGTPIRRRDHPCPRRRSGVSDRRPGRRRRLIKPQRATPRQRLPLACHAIRPSSYRLPLPCLAPHPPCSESLQDKAPRGCEAAHEAHTKRPVGPRPGAHHSVSWPIASCGGHDRTGARNGHRLGLTRMVHERAATSQSRRPWSTTGCHPQRVCPRRRFFGSSLHKITAGSPALAMKLSPAAATPRRAGSFPGRCSRCSRCSRPGPRRNRRTRPTAGWRRA
jgi:hypothetical protein